MSPSSVASRFTSIDAVGPRTGWASGASSENPSFGRAAAAYQSVLRDAETFEARTIEALIAAPTVLPGATQAAICDRYVARAAQERTQP